MYNLFCFFFFFEGKWKKTIIFFRYQVPLDYVLFATSTLEMKGGAFEVFHGTRDEAAHIHQLNLTLPTARVEPIRGAAGYAVLLQGVCGCHTSINDRFRV